MLSPKNKAITELVLCGAIWGYGFIAVNAALEFFGPMWINNLRNFMAAAVALPVVFLIPKFRAKFTLPLFLAAGAPGTALALALVFQTWGMKYTSVTKSGFITTLYVLFVPIGMALVHKHRISIWHWAYVLLALLGTALMCNFEWNGDGWNKGDALVLIAAILMAVQFLLIDRTASKFNAPFLFNTAQTVWGFLVTLPFALLLEGTSLNLSRLGLSAWAMMGFLAWISTLLAFGVQVDAQKHLPPSTTSLLCLLESPFAAVFAVVFLSESQSVTQWIGGFMILGAAAGVSLLTIQPQH